MQQQQQQEQISWREDSLSRSLLELSSVARFGNPPLYPADAANGSNGADEHHHTALLCLQAC